MNDTRHYPFAIAAGGMQLMPIGCERFVVRSTTGPVVVTWARGKLTGLDAGQGYRTGPVDQLILNNTGAGAIAGVIQMADDDFIDNRVQGSMTLSGGTLFSNSAPAVTNASTLLIAANATRKFLLIQNKHISASIWLGYGVAATTQGHWIGPKGHIGLDLSVTLGAIYAIGDIANNTDVCVVEG